MEIINFLSLTICIHNKDKSCFGYLLIVGFWNTIVIRVEDGNVVHIMNGRKVVEYTLWTPEWDELVQNSKFKNFPGFKEGISKEGFIGLQDHGYTVWFKNLKIREL